ncbi:MAG: transporter substrate-binding domain-containing protein, partial [Clostridia bacterium]|nr:transporter substrate-binding domain-containing protein [Clostridia bacterium]
MKKFLAIVLAALMLFSLAACGDNTTNEPKEVVKIIDINLTEEEYAFGVDKNQPELLEDVNEFIDKIMADGTFDEICNKYFGDGTPTAVKSAEEDPSKDQLVVATNAAFAPFEYMEGDSYYGIDMEIAALLAEELGKELVINNMKF